MPPALGPSDGEMVLSAAERAIVMALARTAMPAGRVVAAPGPATVERYQREFASYPAAVRAAFRSTMWAIELGGVVTRRSRFTRMTATTALDYLQGWQSTSAATRPWVFRLLGEPPAVATVGAAVGA